MWFIIFSLLQVTRWDSQNCKNQLLNTSGKLVPKQNGDYGTIFLYHCTLSQKRYQVIITEITCRLLHGTGSFLSNWQLFSGQKIIKKLNLQTCIFSCVESLRMTESKRSLKAQYRKLTQHIMSCFQSKNWFCHKRVPNGFLNLICFHSCFYSGGISCQDFSGV
jgi:hypothetical protein